jgi:cytochrome c oxidase subunit 1
MYSERWGRIAAVLICVGFLLTFLPQFVLGYEGLPRRVATYDPRFQLLQVMSSAGSTILGLGYLLPTIYLPLSLRRGARVGKNPWGATGLEWRTTSPPPPHNFTAPPIVDEEAYDYPNAPAPEVGIGARPAAAAGGGDG